VRAEAVEAPLLEAAHNGEHPQRAHIPQRVFEEGGSRRAFEHAAGRVNAMARTARGGAR
jgi:hypothetical protein